MRFETLLVLVGLGIGFFVGHSSARPEDKFGKLTSITYECSFCCGKQNAIPSLKDGAACTVTVVKQYCRIIDYPTPHQICFTTREEIPGVWNESSACCEAKIEGRKVCVRPSLH
ncbi:MAG: hypothetical protein K2X77_26365 [Candidatus Obscuribacterales bacterium]|nr:hypothetical protein [Candidatus Obscuribacterales bacterium]